MVSRAVDRHRLAAADHRRAARPQTASLSDALGGLRARHRFPADLDSRRGSDHAPRGRPSRRGRRRRGVRCIAFPPAARWLDCRDAILRAAGCPEIRSPTFARQRRPSWTARSTRLTLQPLRDARGRAELLRHSRHRAVERRGRPAARPRTARHLSVARFRRRANAGAAGRGRQRSIKTELLDALGPARGMLYYHLLARALAQPRARPSGLRRAWKLASRPPVFAVVRSARSCPRRSRLAGHVLLL